MIHLFAFFSRKKLDTVRDLHLRSFQSTLFIKFRVTTMSDTPIIPPKHDLHLVTMADGGVGIRGFKTIYNKKMLETVAQYDRTVQTWRFNDLASARSAWDEMVRLCEERQAAKQAQPSEWKRKKTPEEKEKERADKDARKRKRATTTTSSEEEPQPKRKRKAAATTQASIVATVEEDDEDASEDLPIVATVSTIEEPIADNTTNASEVNADDEYDTNLLSQSVEVVEIRQGEQKPSRPLPKPNARTRKIKVFEEDENAPLTSTIDDCVIASVDSNGSSSVSHTAPMSAPAPARKKERRTTAVVAQSDPTSMAIMSYAAFEFLYAVGKTIPMCIRYRVRWKPPALNDLFWPSHCDEIIVPCEILEHSLMDGRVYLSIQPREIKRWRALTSEDGLLWHTTGPHDTFRFRSQAVAGLKDRDMRKCVFEPIFSSMWYRLLDDPEHAFHLSIRL
jgi:hypothetical protein